MKGAFTSALWSYTSRRDAHVCFLSSKGHSFLDSRLLGLTARAASSVACQVTLIVP